MGCGGAAAAIGTWGGTIGFDMEASVSGDSAAALRGSCPRGTDSGAMVIGAGEAAVDGSVTLVSADSSAPGFDCCMGPGTGLVPVGRALIRGQTGEGGSVCECVDV